MLNTSLTARWSHRAQTLAVLATALASQATLAILLIFVARTYPPHDLGVALGVVATSTAIASLSDFGLTNFAVRALARSEGSAQEVATRFRSRNLLLLCVAFGVAGLLAQRYGYLAVWASLVTVAATFSATSQVPLRALGHSQRLVWGVAFDRLCLVAAYFASGTVISDLGLRLTISFTVGMLAGAFLNRISARRLIRMKAQGFLWNPWSGLRHFGVFTAANSAQQLDLPVLGMVAGSGAAGTFGAVSRFTGLTAAIGASFSSTAIHYFARANSARSAWRQVAPAAWILLVTAGGCVSVAVYSEEVTVRLLGANYVESHPVLKLLAMAAVLALVNQPLAAYLMTTGHEKSVAVVTVVATVLQFAVIISTAPLIGPLAGALGFLTLHTLSLAGYAVALRSALKQPGAQVI